MRPRAARAYTQPPMTAFPPGYPPPYPPPVPQPSSADRVRAAWQRRNESDYIFDFPTALGWTFLTCGLYGIYVVYQLVRRAREHNLRRLEMLDAATTFGWEQAQARGVADELRPSFERISQHMTTLRAQVQEFRDPAIWTVLAVFFLGIVEIVAFILLDGDLVGHDYAEGAIEHDLATIYTRLGAPLPFPDPARLKGHHRYVERVIVAVVTLGIYLFWWEYDVMTEGNRHFQQNWGWEDELAQAVQRLITA
jgi:hypothetical protein